jgi:hypothetical protein
MYIQICISLYNTYITTICIGVTRGLGSTQTVNKDESERLSTMMNMDIKQIMEDMKIQEKCSPIAR